MAAAAAIVVAFTAVAMAGILSSSLGNRYKVVMDWGGERGGNTEGAQKTDFRSNP